MTPDRPRLSDRILARRHKIDGREQVTLHDSASGALLLIACPDWELLRLADGTRDLQEIFASALLAGRKEEELSAFFDALRREGVFTETVNGKGAIPTSLYTCPAPEGRAERPVEVLADFELVCDGSGDCCSQYGSIVLTEDDARRARRAGLASESPGAFSGDALMPFSGARSTRLALPLVDGACAELTTDGRCGLHARGGADAKPVACAAFPATLVDDGEAVRSSYACECVCVFESAALEQRPPKTAAPCISRALDLRDGLSVRILPELVWVTREVAAERAAVVRWSRRALLEPVPSDVVERLLQESEGLAAASRQALAAADATVADDSDPPSPSERLAREVALFRDRAAAAAKSAEAWRSARDRTRAMRRSVADAAARLSNPDVMAEAMAEHRFHADETFFYRSALHGHAFIDAATPVAIALERAAAALLVARSLGTDSDASRHPLAAVLAVARGMTA